MSEMRMPVSGDTFAAYRIEREIGRGGMGVVYLAEHLHLERKVALKLLPPDYSQDENFRARFIRESKLAASLQHPSIVPIYDAGENDGLLFIAMLYVEGSDLKELIRREGALDPQRALNIVEQIGSALDEAHESSLVHRDVKPQNTLVAAGRRRERAYLTDFGLTKRYDSKSEMTATGMIVGTIDYMSPEQLNGDPVDGRTDVYSLGCMLYESLTGAVPYERDTLPAAIAAHLTAPPPKASEAGPHLPAGLDDVIAIALAKSRAERYATCGELARALRDVLESTPAIALGTETLRDETVQTAVPRDAVRSTAEKEAAVAKVGAAVVPPVPGHTISPPLTRAQLGLDSAVQPTHPPEVPPRLSSMPGRGTRLALIILGLVGVVLAVGIVWMLTRGGP